MQKHNVHTKAPNFVNFETAHVKAARILQWYWILQKRAKRVAESKL